MTDDKVETWRIFKRRMKVIFLADGVSPENQYTLIFVVIGNEEFNS